MGKRGNGEGSINRRKNGRWMAQYVVYTSEGRKRRTLYGKTRQDVAAKLAKALTDREGGLSFEAGTLTLGDYLDRWLSESVRDSVRHTTYVRYEGIVRNHLKPALGGIKIKGLTPTHVRSLYREKLDSGLAARTVGHIHTTLHKAIKQAVMDGLLPRNVTDAVKVPRQTKKEINPLSPDQARALLDAVRGDRLEALYVLATTSGLRQGELLGLKWADLDFDAGKLSVRRTLTAGSVYSSSGPVFDNPKRAKSHRSIKLTTRAVEALKRHKATQNEERLRLGTLWEDHNLVFPNRVGKPMDHNNLYQRDFKRALERAELPSTFRFHDLRHTCATLLLSKNVNPKIVQEMLGHANISQTMDTYSHVLPNMQAEAAIAMESALT